MSRAMVAIRVHEFGGVEKLIFQDVKVPTLQNDKVLIKVHAAGVNPVETYIRQGTYTRLPQLPYIPGSDGAGVVAEVGADLKAKFKVGQRVFFSRHVQGSYAEFTLADEKSCWSLPDFYSFEQGASFGIPFFTAYRALFQKAKAKPGQTVLVHGASGAVGLAACQLAKLHGLTVFGTVGTIAGEEIVKSVSADFIFNHKEENYLEKIRSQTENGQGVDIILEMLANVNLGHDLPLLKQNGVVVVIGSRGQVMINPRDLMTSESSILSVSLFKSTDSEFDENISKILQLINKNALTSFVGEIYPLAEAAEAHREVIAHKKGTRGKLVLKVR